MTEHTPEDDRMIDEAALGAYRALADLSLEVKAEAIRRLKVLAGQGVTMPVMWPGVRPPALGAPRTS
jgi:hypothetical protein